MKVAVCFFGICRGDVKKNIASHKHHFPFDYFYGTWDEKRADLDQNQLPISFTTPEPIIHYHPIVDNTYVFPSPALDWITGEGGVKRIIEEGHPQNRHAQKYTGYSKTAHGTKQILGHAYTLSQLPKEYDMIIRTRFDNRLCKDVDFSPFLKQSFDERKAIGFGAWHGKHLYKFDKLIVNPLMFKLNDWIIMHPRDLFDVEQAYFLHNEKQLWFSEIGWYQMLGFPHNDNHINVSGGVCIEKKMGRLAPGYK